MNITTQEIKRVGLSKPIRGKTRTLEESTPILVVDEHVSLEDQIARRANELWQQRNREHGYDLTDWLQAEWEIGEWHQKRLQAKR
jgi:Protein of unknown function (DUF2934)